MTIASSRRSAATLIGGTAMAQALPILTIPILTRLYSPMEIGALALFSALVAILAPIAAGRLEQAIVIARTDEDAADLFALGMVVVTTFSLLMLFALLAFRQELASALGAGELEHWLLMLPVATFLTGAYNLLHYTAIRYNRYKQAAQSLVLRSTFVASGQVGLGLLKLDIAGLIVPQALANGASGSKLAGPSLRSSLRLQRFAPKRLRLCLSQHRNFPLYGTWGALASTTSAQATGIAVSAYFSVVTLGLFSVAQRALSTPVTLLSSGLTQLVLKSSASEVERTGYATHTFRYTVLRLIAVSMPSAAILYACAPILVELILGAAWKDAADFIRVMVPALAMRMVASPLSAINTSVHRVRGAAGANGVLLLMTLVGLAAGLISGSSALATIGFVSVGQTAFYFGYLSYTGWNASRGLSHLPSEK